MFAHFAFTQKADSDTTSDDENPLPSPKSKSSEEPSPTMATLAIPTPTLTGGLFNQDGDRIECLVRKMSQQTFVRDSQSMLSLELQNREVDFNLQADQMPIRIPMDSLLTSTGPSILPATVLPTGSGLVQPIVPAIDSHSTQSTQQQQRYEIIDNHNERPIVNGDPNLAAPDGNTPWRQPGSRPSSASNSRTLDLMTTMIENGVQCNVHTSRPTSPKPSPYPLTSNLIPPSSEPIKFKSPDYNLNPQMFHDSNMELEVDPNFCLGDDDDEVALSGPSALRDASTPAGVRKFGYLKYRSSYEAAARCKNMKRNIPRMRKRPKVTRPPGSTAPSSSATSTAH
ncbi:hypothetical protein F5B19DRAFT_65141 [Rostrohypoxylon terebratum]|nr:hypothetical protein F5B19DRAFT_65141 [Rostrohypoxylon terebratum]